MGNVDGRGVSVVPPRFECVVDLGWKAAPKQVYKIFKWCGAAGASFGFWLLLPRFTFLFMWLLHRPICIRRLFRHGPGQSSANIHLSQFSCKVFRRAKSLSPAFFDNMAKPDVFR